MEIGDSTRKIFTQQLVVYINIGGHTRGETHGSLLLKSACAHRQCDEFSLKTL